MGPATTLLYCKVRMLEWLHPFLENQCSRTAQYLPARKDVQEVVFAILIQNITTDTIRLRDIQRTCNVAVGNYRPAAGAGP